MKVVRNGSQITFKYKAKKGLSEEEIGKIEIEKAKKEIEKLSEYLDWYKWNYEEAKKNYEKRVNRIKDLGDYIKVWERDLKAKDESSQESGQNEG